MFDLILRGGHLVDPSQSIDGRRDVAFAGGKVALIAETISEAATDVRDVSGLACQDIVREGAWWQA